MWLSPDKQSIIDKLFMVSFALKIEVGLHLYVLPRDFFKRKIYYPRLRTSLVVRDILAILLVFYFLLDFFNKKINKRFFNVILDMKNYQS